MQEFSRSIQTILQGLPWLALFLPLLAAGIIGLETYWIFRGWTRGDGLTMLLGIVSVIAVSALVWWYIDSLGEILRANSTVPWVYGYERSISGD